MATVLRPGREGNVFIKECQEDGLDQHPRCRMGGRAGHSCAQEFRSRGRAWNGATAARQPDDYQSHRPGDVLNVFSVPKDQPTAVSTVCLTPFGRLPVLVGHAFLSDQASGAH